MRDSFKFRILFIISCCIFTILNLYYSKSSTVPWILILSIIILVGIVDSGLTIYKDYYSKHMDKKTYESVFSFISFIIILIITLFLFIHRLLK